MGGYRFYSGNNKRIILARISCLKGKDSGMMPWTFLEIY